MTAEPVDTVATAAIDRRRSPVRSYADGLKRFVDVAGAAALLLVLLPLLAVIALAVRATSPGPALFRQTRVGRHGSTIVIYKFRSMRLGAEEELAGLRDHNDIGVGPLFKMRDDPRVTAVGRLLRRYSLDELPQLANVLTGSMSLVGPRPALPDEVARYDARTLRRLLVRPGLTGLWQVSGRSDLDWHEGVRLDLDYVDRASLALDAAILARTIPAVLATRGAY